MNPERPSNAALTRAPRLLWLWLAGLLLAFNAGTTLPHAPRLDPSELRAAVLTAPVPANAQFRDPAAAIKAAAQRALKAQDRPDGDPPVPAHHAAFAPHHPAPSPRLALPRASDSPRARPTRRYHARAPPVLA